MVRCVSDQAFEEQKWKASLLNMTPEEKKSEIARETVRRAEQKRKDEIERNEAAWKELKETTPSEWGEVVGGLLVIGLVIAGIIYMVSK